MFKSTLLLFTLSLSNQQSWAKYDIIDDFKAREMDQKHNKPNFIKNDVEIEEFQQNKNKGISKEEKQRSKKFFQGVRQTSPMKIHHRTNAEQGNSITPIKKDNDASLKSQDTKINKFSNKNGSNKKNLNEISLLSHNPYEEDMNQVQDLDTKILFNKN